MSSEVDKLVERAYTQIRHNHLHGAIESLRQALTLDADDAHAHALLAICLHDQKRLHAAEYESRAALALNPDSGFVHYASAVVAIAQRRFKEAEKHLETALSIDPTDAASLRRLAQLYVLWGRQNEALPLLTKARDIDPGDADNWAALAEYHREMRDFSEADRLVRRALELEPENTDALLTMGHLLLQQGRTEEAREHALLVLHDNASHEGAIVLLAAVKARRSVFLGLWWPFNSFFGAGSLTRRVVLLIGCYLAYRVAILAVADLGYPQAASPINIFWIAFCVYTWVGPVLFERQLRRELEPAKLDSRY